jgi:hypothetical protein
MGKDFVEEERRVPGAPEDCMWSAGNEGWHVPGGSHSNSHGRNWRLLSVLSARPSRSGMSWPMRSPTAVAKGEPRKEVKEAGMVSPALPHRSHFSHPPQSSGCGGEAATGGPHRPAGRGARGRTGQHGAAQ